MRTLKFRFYDEKYRTWYKGLGPLIYADSPLVKQGYTIQQYIGLKDKNGKEIYEGDYINFSCNWTVELGDKDIVEYKNQHVHYDETIASFVFGHEQEFTILDKIMLSTLEVVGNVFDNPELDGKEQ